jgi:hypothetical protein
LGDESVPPLSEALRSTLLLICEEIEMVVTVYVRHSSDCNHRSDAAYRRCGCPLRFRHAIGHGRQKIRIGRHPVTGNRRPEGQQLQDHLEREALGLFEPKVEPITIEKAVEDYLAEKLVAGLAEETTAKLAWTAGRTTSTTVPSRKAILKEHSCLRDPIQVTHPPRQHGGNDALQSILSSLSGAQ